MQSEKKSTPVVALKILKYISTVHSYEKNMIFIYESLTSFYQASTAVNVVGHPGNWPIFVLQFVCSWVRTQRAILNSADETTYVLPA